MNFIQQVYKGKNNWWRWLLVCFLVMSPFVYKAYKFIVDFNEPFKQIKQNSNLSLIIIFSWYILFTLILFLAVKLIHKRPIKSLINPTGKIDLWRFIFGLSLGGLFILIFFSISYFQNPSIYQWNFKLKPFLILAFICFTLIPVGALFKEVFFRGYLLQGFSLLLNSKWKALVVTSLLYVVVFGLTPLVKSVGFEILIYYFASSILTGVIVLLDDRLELAVGARTANYIFRFLYITTLWSPIKTNAIFLDVSQPKIFNLVYIPILIFFPLFLYCLKEMYGWKNCKEKIFGKVY